VLTDVAQAIMAISKAWWIRHNNAVSMRPPIAAFAVVEVLVLSLFGSKCCICKIAGTCVAFNSNKMQSVSMAAELEDKAQGATGIFPDIWQDKTALQVLRAGSTEGTAQGKSLRTNEHA
jgi:hypothetical protein